MRTWLRPNASMMASRFAEIGKSGSCLKTSSRALRAAAAAPRSFATLDFLPKPLLCIEVQVREDLTAPHRQRFHAAKSPLELGIGGAQRRLGIHIEFAANLARKLDVDAEAALRSANAKFERRFLRKSQASPAPAFAPARFFPARSARPHRALPPALRQPCRRSGRHVRSQSPRAPPAC